MQSSSIIRISPLSFPWQTLIVFLCCIMFSCKNDESKNSSIKYKNEEKRRIPIPNNQLFTDYKVINGVTFDVSKVDPLQDSFQLFSPKDVFEDKIGKEILYFPEEHKNFGLIQSNYNSLLESIHLSYSSHRPLIISPDIIWLAITQGISIHINNNFKQYKSNLFIHDKPQEITITNNELNKDAKAWEQLINSFSKESTKYVKQDLNSFFAPQFSTTTNIETTVYQTTMLETYEKGLIYTAVSSCGIPKITITGTLEDWQKIYAKLDSLDIFGLGYWKEELKPIIQEFINAKSGKVKQSFWQELYKNNEYYSYSYYSGWIIKFFPYVREPDYDKPVKNKNMEEYQDYVYDKYIPNEYLKDKDYLLSKLQSDDFPNGIAQIDIKWINFNKEMKMNVYAGYLGIKQHKDSSLEPLISWALCRKNASKVDINLGYRYPKRHNVNKPFWTNTLYTKVDETVKYDKKSIVEFKKELEKAFKHKFNSTDTIKVHFIVAYNGKLLKIETNTSDKSKEQFIKSYFLKLKGNWTPGKKSGNQLEEVSFYVNESELDKLYEVNSKVELNLFDGK